MELPFKTEKRVLEWQKIGDKYLVIYDYMAFPKDAPARNLFAYTENGDFLWQAEPFSSMNTDASVNFLSENPLVVGNFAGYDITYDIETGKVLSTKFTK
ncbi:MAG TPA: hypothetical protein VEM15_06980 [Thermodesulfobacteriota bacterium]|nr:hypothetical protein [Thermodesulfobacteriota bacterium]